MTNQKMRIEKDSMGEMRVPESALWGASTERARQNFPVAGRGIPAEIVHAFGHLKAACAQVNKDLGKLDPATADAIIAAAEEVAQGRHDDHFVVDVYQTGSGTSSNMNANEVIARLAEPALAGGSGGATGGLPASADPGQHTGGQAASGTQSTLPGVPGVPGVHPNDHVNMGQSSNDTFPTAMHIAAATALQHRLKPALDRVHDELANKAKQWDDIVKIGRTHLMDATPIRVGQVFSGYAQQAAFAQLRAGYAFQGMRQNLAIGGTAVGTGINTHREFGQRVAKVLAQRTGIDFEEAVNHPEAQAAKDCFVQAHGCLKTIAVSLSKIASDIRLLGSGPRCGIGELQLPAIQPGSSIMPGKVNPVICESVIQVACRVIANDSAVTLGGLGGIGSIFELNVAMPMMADAFMESVNLLSNVCNVFVDKLLVGLEVNRERCAALVEQSLMVVTSLAPEIGYDKAAKIAKQALKENKTIRELVKAQGLLDDDKLDILLDPRGQTEPGE